MPTIGEAISEVREDLRLVGVDEWVPARYIHQKLSAFAEIIMKNSSESRRIFGNADLFITIPCIQLVPAVQPAAGLTMAECSSLAHSVKNIPALYSTVYNNIIHVSTVYIGAGNQVMEGKRLYQTSPEEYRLTLKARYKSPNDKFWIEDKKLWVTNRNLEIVRVRGMFKEGFSIVDYDACNCAPATAQDCTFLSKPFICPGYLYKDVRAATVEDIRRYRLGIAPDENPNNNENIKQ